MGKSSVFAMPQEGTPSSRLVRGLGWLVGWSAAVIPLLGLACAQAPAAPAAPVTLLETFQHLRELHQDRSYGPMRQYLDGAAGRDTIDLLMAVDELLANDAGARYSLKAASPGVDLQPYDHSRIADHLGLFSRQVRVVKSAEREGRGALTLQIFDCSGSEPVARLPLETLAFERRQGRWMYLPDTQEPGVADLVREMARSLRDISRVASAGNLNSKQVAREYYLRLGPLLREMHVLAGRLPQDAPLGAVPSSGPAAS